jgi:hypothetical protein
VKFEYSIRLQAILINSSIQVFKCSRDKGHIRFHKIYVNSLLGVNTANPLTPSTRGGETAGSTKMKSNLR